MSEIGPFPSDAQLTGHQNDEPVDEIGDGVVDPNRKPSDYRISKLGKVELVDKGEDASEDGSPDIGRAE